MTNKSQNDNTTAAAINALERRVRDIAFSDFPSALRTIGAAIIEETKQTHEYRNRTGALEASHDFAVVEPGKTVTVEIDTRDGQQALTLDSPANQISLFLFTHKQYGLWVETKNGFAVLIHGFLKLRRGFSQMFKSAFKSRLIR